MSKLVPLSPKEKTLIAAIRNLKDQRKQLDQTIAELTGLLMSLSQQREKPDRTKQTITNPLNGKTVRIGGREKRK